MRREAPQYTLLMCTVLTDTTMARRPRPKPSRHSPSVRAFDATNELDSLLGLRPLHRPVATAETFTPQVDDMREIEDRRLFNPDPLKPARSIRGRGVSIQPKAETKRRKVVAWSNPQFAFKAPKATLVCLRRSIRKEVIHALKKAGKRGKGRRRRRNQFSDVRC